MHAETSFGSPEEGPTSSYSAARCYCDCQGQALGQSEVHMASFHECRMYTHAYVHAAIWLHMHRALSTIPKSVYHKRHRVMHTWFCWRQILKYICLVDVNVEGFFRTLFLSATFLV